MGVRSERDRREVPDPLTTSFLGGPWSRRNRPGVEVQRKGPTGPVEDVLSLRLLDDHITRPWRGSVPGVSRSRIISATAPEVRGTGHKGDRPNRTSEVEPDSAVLLFHRRRWPGSDRSDLLMWREEEGGRGRSS